MELEPEAVGKQLLQHLLLLAQVGLAGSVGGALDIKAVAGGPVGRIDNLMLVDGVGEHHQTDDGLAVDGVAVTLRIEALAVGGRIVRLDGGDREGRMRVGCHRLYGRRGLRRLGERAGRG